EPKPYQQIAQPTGSLALAVVVIMYTYSGWHEAAYIVGDLRNPRRSLPWALLAGVGIVTVIYLAINLAAWHALGFFGVRESKAVGVDLLHRAGWGRDWFAGVFVLVSWGSIKGTFLSGPRLFSSIGGPQPGYELLARGRTRRDAPLAALVV